MSAPSEPPAIMKRKRVAKACQTCRLMKSKCDGKRPSCSRCSGYGYACAYAESGRRSRLPTLPDSSSSPSHLSSPAGRPPGDREGTKLPLSDLREVMAEYDGLVQRLVPSLSPEQRASITGDLASITQKMEDAFSRLKLSGAGGSATTQVVKTPRSPSAPASLQSQRYHGEVSDVRFFNLVKQRLREKSVLERIDEGVDSYEQDDLVGQDVAAELSLELPSPDAADEYLDIYFSIIHIAYPFIPRSSFLASYRQMRESGRIENLDTSWVGLLYTIFAIGSYYISFPDKESDSHGIHEYYFQLALGTSSPDSPGRSFNHVCFLLAQCFYLLAVCRTDRCWTTLGLAIRIAQSIGLHVEAEEPEALRGRALLQAETRRRLWYSLYVLDRLLALQLGRPPAIHDDDFHLPLPSRIDDAAINWDADSLPPADDSVPSAGDYFCSVIAFSKIVGDVLRDLYSPRKNRLGADGLLSTKLLDQKLMDWKWGLPRTLRFDFGHTFETSMTFKRQRNNLAVKFHHLRALIHRPYLCLPLLHRADEANNSALQEERHVLDRYEKVCIAEAQETAHLLHNVVSEKDLVCNFPWWQMISCLICASSILLVASVFIRRGLNGCNEELDASALTDDAETCMKVFEALSANSTGARIARDMMRRLRERGEQWSKLQPSSAPRLAAYPPSAAATATTPAASVTLVGSSPATDLPEDGAAGDPSHALPSPPIAAATAAGQDHAMGGAGEGGLLMASSVGSSNLMPDPLRQFTFAPEHLDFGPESSFLRAQDWPSEILEPMAWSAQFMYFGSENPLQ